MKILAIIELAADPPRPVDRTALTEELVGAWQLYSEGVLRAAYATSTPTRVVFELEAPDEVQAHKALARLPLIADGTFRASVIELRPFVNWQRLFDTRDSAQRRSSSDEPGEGRPL